MKELEIIIKPEKLENLKRILDSEGANGVMISSISDTENRKVLSRFIQETIQLASICFRSSV